MYQYQVQPDLNRASFIGDTNKKLLSTPIEGQLWFNTTRNKLYVFDGTGWLEFQMAGDISANWGTICDGEQIPLPTNEFGVDYSYSDCAWIVSPKGTDFEFDYMLCQTDEFANVTMKYGEIGSDDLRSGTANYMIVAIKGNRNIGRLIPCDPPAPAASPAASPVPITPSPTPSATSTPIVAVTITPSPTIGVSVTATPVPTQTRTPTPEPIPETPEPTPEPIPETPEPTPTRTPAPGVSQPPTPPPTSTPASTPPPSASPAETPPATPPETPPATPPPSPEIVFGAWGLVSTTCQEVLEVEDLPQDPCTSANAGQVVTLFKNEGVGESFNCFNTFECIVL